MKTNRINVVLSLNKSGRFGDLGDGNDLGGHKGTNFGDGTKDKLKVTTPASSTQEETTDVKYRIDGKWGPWMGD